MCIRILRQQYYGNRTRFKKYFLTSVALHDIHDSNTEIDVLLNDFYDIVPDVVMSKINTKIATMEYYERRIMELYFYGDNKNEKKIKPLSMRSIHEATGISRHELNRVVNNFKNECTNSIDWNCGNG